MTPTCALGLHPAGFVVDVVELSSTRPIALPRKSTAKGLGCSSPSLVITQLIPVSAPVLFPVNRLSLFPDEGVVGSILEIPMAQLMVMKERSLRHLPWTPRLILTSIFLEHALEEHYLIQFLFILDVAKAPDETYYLTGHLEQHHQMMTGCLVL